MAAGSAGVLIGFSSTILTLLITSGAGVLNQRLVSLAIGLLAVAGGILSLRSLNIDAFPDMTPVRVEVDTSGPVEIAAC